MADITVPDQQAAVGKCGRCGAEFKIDPIWYQFFIKIKTILNGI